MRRIHSHFLQCTLVLREDDKFHDLAISLSKQKKVSAAPQNITFCDVYDKKIWATYKHTESIAMIKSTDLTFAFETLDPEAAGIYENSVGYFCLSKENN